MKLNEQAYNYIKSMILSEKLKYDTCYSETKLAKAIGISRTPLRDALVRLSDEGFLDIQESRGFYLHKLTLSDLEDMFQMRMALEGFALVQIAKSLEDPESVGCISALEENLLLQEEYAKEPDGLEKLVNADQQFHRLMISFIKNPTLESLYFNQIYRIKGFARKSFEHEGRTVETLLEHRNILQALKERDPVKAYLAAETHLDNLVVIMRGMIVHDAAFL